MTDDGGTRRPRDAGSGGAVRAARILLLAMALLVPAPASADDYPRQPGVDVERYRHRDGNALTADFRQIMEEAAGEDLSGFFEQWVFRPGHPELAGSWRWERTAGTLAVTVQQQQAGEPFRFPLDLAIRLRDGTTVRRTVRVDGPSERFEISLESAPSAVEPDPDVWLLFEDVGFRPAR